MTTSVHNWPLLNMDFYLFVLLFIMCLQDDCNDNSANNNSGLFMCSSIIPLIIIHSVYCNVITQATLTSVAFQCVIP